MIDFDSLTIGEAKRLASMFGGTVAAPTNPPAENIGEVVLLRTFAAGVWIGRKVWERESGAVVKLTEARRVWKFKGAGDCSELSLVGPRDGGQIGPVVTTTIQGVIEEYVATPACIEAVAKVLPWSR